MSSSNNEILNRVLELCEEHMTEGEYLRSSKLLKTVSDKNPDNSSLLKTNRFIDPIRIKIGHTFSIFISGYVARRHNIHSEFNLHKVLIKIQNSEIQVTAGTAFSNSFSEIIQTFIKSEMAFDVEVFDFFGIEGHIKRFTFDKFRDFFSDLNDDVYSIELYYEFVEYVSKFISSYVSNLVREWKNEPIS